MPRFAATALGWTGGGQATTPYRAGQSHKADRQGRSDGSGCLGRPPGLEVRHGGCVAPELPLLPLPDGAPQGRADCPLLQPVGSPHSWESQPRPTALSLAGYLKQGALQEPSPPPLGWEISLVSAVEQKAAHPWVGGPLALPAHVPAPRHSQLGHRPWQPPPPTVPSCSAFPPPSCQHTARAPPSGAARETPPNSTGAATGRAQH